jgi:hypothetical protein
MQPNRSKKGKIFSTVGFYPVDEGDMASQPFLWHTEERKRCCMQSLED